LPAAIGTTAGRCWAGPFIAAGIQLKPPLRGHEPPDDVGSIAWRARSFDTAKTAPVPTAPGRTPGGARFAAPVEYAHCRERVVSNGVAATVRRDEYIPAPLSTNSEYQQGAPSGSPEWLHEL
jgi:hypothetical protein